jgi:hypothetical protein
MGVSMDGIVEQRLMQIWKDGWRLQENIFSAFILYVALQRVLAINMVNNIYIVMT